MDIGDPAPLRPLDTELGCTTGHVQVNDTGFHAPYARLYKENEVADPNGDTQIDDDSEDAGIDDSIRTNICVSCKGSSGCQMASVPWFGQQMCTLCFNMNLAMLMIKEGDLEGRYCFALNAALQSVLDKSDGEKIAWALATEAIKNETASDSTIAG